MPIRRTYACPECNHFWEITLEMSEADAPPPSCPACDMRDTQQVFKAPGIVNSSPNARANAVVEDIRANDYHVADLQRDHRHESTPTRVRYKDSTASELPSSWGTGLGISAGDAMATALAVGRQNRLEFGSGLEVLQANLRNGTQPDLIEQSKKRSAKLW